MNESIKVGNIMVEATRSQVCSPIPLKTKSSAMVFRIHHACTTTFSTCTLRHLNQLDNSLNQALTLQLVLEHTMLCA
jgi:hypothetical protein